jgi:hypothetical protein
MMPQKEVNEAIYQQADQAYEGYEGNQTSSARQHYETSDAQEMRESPTGKVYPRPRDYTTLLRFALPVISLGLLLLFGLLFVVVVGGTTGWISFVAACFVICCILAYVATMSQHH